MPLHSFVIPVQEVEAGDAVMERVCALLNVSLGTASALFIVVYPANEPTYKNKEVLRRLSY
jgi:hypothetical protein